MTSLSPLKPVLSPEVAEALHAGRPVVALESTIISHGMPYPANVETARGVEAVVRENGAVPATIAVIDGFLHAGLSDSSLDRLGSDRTVVKAASRDLAAVMVRKLSAGTTVSATMRLAELAGIAIFATGGIGGVHRGAADSFDISADLIELGRTRTAVVSAGVKSILDIPKTLEYLETQRVPVIGFGTDAFPAFYTRDSGCPIEHRFDHARQIAEVIAYHRSLEVGSGLLVANPIPAEFSLDPAMIESTIAQALADAAERGIAAKAVTPFLLARIAKLSGGVSVKSNIALVRNNAALAAQIAVAYAALGR